MSDEEERRAGASRPPEFEELRQEMHEAIDQFHADYDAGRLATAGGPTVPTEIGLLDRLRSLFTFRRVSLALNVFFAVILLLAFRERSLFGALPVQVEILQYSGGSVDPDAREWITVREPSGSGGEQEQIWTRGFDGIVVQATMAPWPGTFFQPKPRYLVVARLQYGLPGTISVWDVREKNPDRQMIWERTVPLDEMRSMFPDPMTEGAGAWCNGFTFADLDGDGEHEIAAMFHHDVYFPACVRTLDRDGEVRGTYWNWGYFDAILARDVDADGRDEIIASGTNNVFQGGTVVMLDADHLSGCSMDDTVAERLSRTDLAPELGEDRFRDGSFARIVFPMWHEELAAYFNSNRVHAAQMSYLPDPPTFNVRIGQGLHIAWKMNRAAARGVTLPDSGVWVDLRLDATLRPVDLIVPDGLTARLRRAREDGEIDVPADSHGHWEQWAASFWYHGPPSAGTEASPS